MQLGKPRLRPTIRLFVIDGMNWTMRFNVHVNLIRSFITDKNTVKCKYRCMF